MRMRAIAAASAALVLTAASGCAGGSSSGGGRLRLERVLGARSATLLDRPALASYCPRDSLLTIIATGRRASAGFALSVVLPWRGMRTFHIGASLAAGSEATADFRFPNGVARLGVTGTLQLDAPALIDGEFDVMVSDSAGVPARVRGRLTGIPVRHWPPPTCGGV